MSPRFDPRIQADEFGMERLEKRMRPNARLWSEDAVKRLAIAPAVGNALFDATGERRRSMPLLGV